MFQFSDPMTSAESFAYAKYLYDHLDQAEHLEVLEVSINGQPPNPKMCHDNVNRFVEENDQYAPIYGWLVIDSPNAVQCLFLAHSVIADKNGKLYEITPIEALDPRPFIRANLSDYDFEQIYFALGRYSGDFTIAHTK